MKTGKFFGKKIIVASLAVLACAFTFSSCDKDDDDDNTTRTYNLSGSASGSQVTPAPTGAASASGTLTGSYNPSTRVMTYTTTWANLTGAPVTGGFYTGASGVNGPLVGSAWTFDATATGTGSMSGSMTLTAEQGQQLINNGMYYMYITATNPTGETRGQITATQQ